MKNLMSKKRNVQRRLSPVSLLGDDRKPEIGEIYGSVHDGNSSPFEVAIPFARILTIKQIKDDYALCDVHYIEPSGKSFGGKASMLLFVITDTCKLLKSPNDQVQARRANNPKI